MKINLGKIQDVSDLNPMRINKLISDLEKALLRVPDVKEQDTVYLTKDNAVTGINSYTKAQTYSGGIEVNTLPLALVGAPINCANIVTVASATAPAIGAAASNNISISGTTQIDGFDDVAVGITRNIVFEGILQLTHSATLVLPTGANITTAAGDTCMAQQIATGTQGWRIFSYQRADGTALVAGEAAASTTVSGIIEIATDAEWLAGTDTSRAVTPGNLASSKSLAESGYQKFAGGLIIQWGTKLVNTDVVGALGVSCTFPIAFPNNLFQAYAVIQDTTGTWDTFCIFSRGSSSLSVGYFVVREVTASTQSDWDISYFAIGN